MNEEQVFLAALEIASPADRSEFLDRSCGGDAHLRASVESLLRHHVEARGFLESPPDDLVSTVEALQDETMCAPGSAGRRAEASGADESNSSSATDGAALDRTLARIPAGGAPGSLGRLGPYEIHEVLGQGGMGVVLRAQDTQLRRSVAIKLMRASAAETPGGEERFLREARSAAAVKHDHVVTIHAVQAGEPAPYLVMELIEGESLEKALKAHVRYSPLDVARIGVQLAEGLAAAHDRGLVHRDVKPANVLVETTTGRVKITDFGLARAVDDGALTREGDVAGTPNYMSPEQVRGERVDARSDLFSLGNVLYALCTGRSAHEKGSTLATLRSVCDEPARPIRESNPDVPPWLEAIILRLLEKAPERRPQSAREVATRLREGIAGTESAREAPVASPLTARRFGRPAVLVAVGALTLAGVILIVQRNGRTVRVEVPDRSTVRVADDGTVTVVPPEAERRAEEPAPSATDPRDVAGKLVERNPGFPGVVETVLAGDDVVEVRFDSDRVKDLSPLRSLTKLERLTCRGNGPEPSELTDLSPLSGLRLKFLDCSNTSVANLEPLRGMPLETLNCAKTNVADLRPLAESPLAELHVQGTRVSDLAPLRGMALRGLNASFTSIVDLAPLRDKPLAWLYLDGVPVKDLTPLEGSPLKMLNVRSLDLSRPETIRVLRSLKNLESVNSESPDEFWKKLPASATP